MKLLRFIYSWYRVGATNDLLYMLQQVNYDSKKFIGWVFRLIKQLKPLYSVSHRKELVKTKRVRLFKYSLLLTEAVLLVLVLFATDINLIVIILLIVAMPAVSVVLLVLASVPLFLMFAQQRFHPEVRGSKRAFTDTKAVKIAVAGSYGKTTAKELLQAILSEGLSVRYTPGNMNTSVAHARFAKLLNGSEDVLIIEYGEERPGDVVRYAKITQPDHAIITGLAPNHLDYYKTLEKLAMDIFSLRNTVQPGNLYVANDSELIKKYIKPEDQTFDLKHVLGWNISSIEQNVDGVDFVMQHDGKKIFITTHLLGKHLVPIIALVVALALKLGLSEQQIKAGLKKVKPHEHRMQPYKLHDAWIIDDTYNGNLQGILAGLSLLEDLEAKRKVYVTPGLVDQGKETEAVHLEIAKKVRDIKPDILVLMKNSATDIIKNALQSLGYDGKVQVIQDPLEFYQSLDKFVVPGDIILMQNDWTDNYN